MFERPRQMAGVSFSDKEDNMSNTFDFVGFAWAVAMNPLAGWGFGALAGFVLALIFKRYPGTRTQAQAFADYLEAIERQAVLAAELAGFVRGIKGYDKLLFALDYVEARLAEQGIVGDPDRVTRERLVTDLGRLKAVLLPDKGVRIEDLINKRII